MERISLNTLSHYYDYITFQSLANSCRCWFTICLTDRKPTIVQLMIVCSTKAIFGILVVLFLEHVLIVSYFQHRAKSSGSSHLSTSAQDVISQIEQEQLIRLNTHHTTVKAPSTPHAVQIPIVGAHHQKQFSKTKILPRSEYMKSVGKDGSKQQWPWQTIKVLNLNRKKRQVERFTARNVR